MPRDISFAPSLKFTGPVGWTLPGHPLAWQYQPRSPKWGPVWSDQRVLFSKYLMTWSLNFFIYELGFGPWGAIQCSSCLLGMGSLPRLMFHTPHYKPVGHQSPPSPSWEENKHTERRVTTSKSGSRQKAALGLVASPLARELH